MQVKAQGQCKRPIRHCLFFQPLGCGNHHRKFGQIHSQRSGQLPGNGFNTADCKAGAEIEYWWNPKAAANLYISQPSLSATVKKVEERIGAPIFDRSVSPIQLTECGRHYIKAVEEIMDTQSRFENYLNDLNELKTGQIAIGGSNLFASYILPPVITRFTMPTMPPRESML